MTLSNKKLHSAQIQVGKRTIHYSELGQGFPVIMLHGGGPGASGMSNYSKNIEALAEKFRVIVPDLAGYGQSTKGVDRADPFGDHANTILGFMAELGIESAHLIGNSLGGATALRMALDQPAKVQSLVLMGPGGVGTTRALPTKGLNKLLNYYTGEGPTIEKLREFIREHLVYDGAAVSEAMIAERFKSSIDPEVVASPPLRRPQGIPNFRLWDFTRDPRLLRCQIPTLVLWGTEDLVNRPNGAQQLQSRMPNCDVVLFSKTGHWVQWERTNEFNAISMAFMTEHSPA
ncbi:alpha/beta fold hydrolase [Limnobacter sp.]|uniref:alpha/beta fold hydrolase n=1 Tax=Limnobacter sp. TaxID=2003368 RepID=UPI0025C02F1D|nr:alpha/beta fold hydrolase [Limnobacter sp.]